MPLRELIVLVILAAWLGTILLSFWLAVRGRAERRRRWTFIGLCLLVALVALVLWTTGSGLEEAPA